MGPSLIGERCGAHFMTTREMGLAPPQFFFTYRLLNSWGGALFTQGRGCPQPPSSSPGVFFLFPSRPPFLLLAHGAFSGFSVSGG